MKLQCGHLASCDLDTICPECGRSFISTQYFHYAIGVIVILLIYYSDSFLRGSYSDKLTILFVLFVLFVEVCILRKKGFELVTNIFILFPVLAVSFKQVILFMFGSEIASYLLFFAYFLFGIPFILALIFGFNDAVQYDNLRKGSFWLITSLFITILTSVPYWTIPIVRQLNPLIDTSLKDIDRYLGLIFYYRSSFMAIVLGFVTVISIASSLKKELNVRKVNNNIVSMHGLNLIDIIWKGLSGYMSNLLEAILTGLDLGRQILEIIFIEIFFLIKDSITRALLITVRVLRVLFLASIMFGISLSINGVVTNIVKLWSSGNFNTMKYIEWLVFFGFCISLVTMMWLYSMFTYKKWKDHLESPLNIRNSLRIFFGTRLEALTAHRSITLSVLMYSFFFMLTFFGAWIIIIPANFIIKVAKPNPLGVLFFLMLSILIVLGVLKLIQNKRYVKIDEEEQNND
ncbi:MAG: hypothetical protein PF638_09835 [Candidatus Delongbacteria bacterium]|jgi:hypothetical protein|nr:hypothetical protein [Candidatus Delongbacteria bacterium]